MKKLALLTIVSFLASIPAKIALNLNKALNIPPEIQKFLNTQIQSKFSRYFLIRITKAVIGNLLSQVIVGTVSLINRKPPKYPKQACIWILLIKRGGIPDVNNLLNNENILCIKPPHIQEAMAYTCLSSN